MKAITLTGMAATLLFWSAPTAEISTASLPRLDSALALALMGTALIAAGAAWRRKPAALRPASAVSAKLPNFFIESETARQPFGGAEVIELASVRRDPGTPAREDGLPPML